MQASAPAPQPETREVVDLSSDTIPASTVRRHAHSRAGGSASSSVLVLKDMPEQGASHLDVSSDEENRKEVIRITSCDDRAPACSQDSLEVVQVRGMVRQRVRSEGSAGMMRLGEAEVIDVSETPRRGNQGEDVGGENWEEVDTAEVRITPEKTGRGGSKFRILNDLLTGSDSPTAAAAAAPAPAAPAAAAASDSSAEVAGGQVVMSSRRRHKGRIHMVGLNTLYKLPALSSEGTDGRDAADVVERSVSDSRTEEAQGVQEGGEEREETGGASRVYRLGAEFEGENKIRERERDTDIEAAEGSGIEPGLAVVLRKMAGAQQQQLLPQPEKRTKKDSSGFARRGEVKARQEAQSSGLTVAGGMTALLATMLQGKVESEGRRVAERVTEMGVAEMGEMKASGPLASYVASTEDPGVGCMGLQCGGGLTEERRGEEEDGRTSTRYAPASVTEFRTDDVDGVETAGTDVKERLGEGQRRLTTLAMGGREGGAASQEGNEPLMAGQEQGLEQKLEQEVQEQGLEQKQEQEVQEQEVQEQGLEQKQEQEVQEQEVQEQGLEQKQEQEVQKQEVQEQEVQEQEVQEQQGWQRTVQEHSESCRVPPEGREGGVQFGNEVPLLPQEAPRQSSPQQEDDTLAVEGGQRGVVPAASWRAPEASELPLQSPPALSVRSDSPPHSPFHRAKRSTRKRAAVTPTKLAATTVGSTEASDLPQADQQLAADMASAGQLPERAAASESVTPSLVARVSAPFQSRAMSQSQATIPPPATSQSQGPIQPQATSLLQAATRSEAGKAGRKSERVGRSKLLEDVPAVRPSADPNSDATQEGRTSVEGDVLVLAYESSERPSEANSVEGRGGPSVRAAQGMVAGSGRAGKVEGEGRVRKSGQEGGWLAWEVRRRRSSRTLIQPPTHRLEPECSEAETPDESQLEAAERALEAGQQERQPTGNGVLEVPAVPGSQHDSGAALVPEHRAVAQAVGAEKQEGREIRSGRESGRRGSRGRKRTLDAVLIDSEGMVVGAESEVSAVGSSEQQAEGPGGQQAPAWESVTVASDIREGGTGLSEGQLLRVSGRQQHSTAGEGGVGLGQGQMAEIGEVEGDERGGVQIGEKSSDGVACESWNGKQTEAGTGKERGGGEAAALREGLAEGAEECVVDLCVERTCDMVRETEGEDEVGEEVKRVKPLSGFEEWGVRRREDQGMGGGGEEESRGDSGKREADEGTEDPLGSEALAEVTLYSECLRGGAAGLRAADSLLLPPASSAVVQHPSALLQVKEPSGEAERAVDADAVRDADGAGVASGKHAGGGGTAQVDRLVSEEGDDDIGMEEQGGSKEGGGTDGEQVEGGVEEARAERGPAGRGLKDVIEISDDEEGGREEGTGGSGEEAQAQVTAEVKAGVKRKLNGSISEGEAHAVAAMAVTEGGVSKKTKGRRRSSEVDGVWLGTMASGNIFSASDKRVTRSQIERGGGEKRPGRKGKEREERAKHSSVPAGKDVASDSRAVTSAARARPEAKGVKAERDAEINRGKSEAPGTNASQAAAFEAHQETAAGACQGADEAGGGVGEEEAGADGKASSRKHAASGEVTVPALAVLLAGGSDGGSSQAAPSGSGGEGKEIAGTKRKREGEVMEGDDAEAGVSVRGGGEGWSGMKYLGIVLALPALAAEAAADGEASPKAGKAKPGRASTSPGKTAKQEGSGQKKGSKGQGEGASATGTMSLEKEARSPDCVVLSDDEDRKGEGRVGVGRAEKGAWRVEIAAHDGKAAQPVEISRINAAAKVVRGCVDGSECESTAGESRALSEEHTEGDDFEFMDDRVMDVVNSRADVIQRQYARRGKESSPSPAAARRRVTRASERTGKGVKREVYRAEEGSAGKASRSVDPQGSDHDMAVHIRCIDGDLMRENPSFPAVAASAGGSHGGRGEQEEALLSDDDACVSSQEEVLPCPVLHSTQINTHGSAIESMNDSMHSNILDGVHHSMRNAPPAGYPGTLLRYAHVPAVHLGTEEGARGDELSAVHHHPNNNEREGSSAPLVGGGAVGVADRQDGRLADHDGQDRAVACKSKVEEAGACVSAGAPTLSGGGDRALVAAARGLGSELREPIVVLSGLALLGCEAQDFSLQREQLHQM